MIFSVSELNEYVSGLLSHDPTLRDLSVEGEISGFKRHSSGHIYFSLKDSASTIRCVMFKQAAYSLTFRPTDGMKVTVGGYASIYTRDGQFQLYAKSIKKHGEGELHRRFMLLKQQLGELGYFDNDNKKPIPYMPRRVGIITSPTGAVLQDISNVIRRRFAPMDMTLYPCKVQGEGAAASMAKGIRALNDLGAVSVIILARGGGSMEDLWAFNERELADAIFKSEIPIISAVGHETDFTIADFVADLRAPTPSAAAELCVPEYDALQMRLMELHNRLVNAPASGIGITRERLAFLLKRADAVIVQKREHSAQALSQSKNRLNECAKNIKAAKRLELDKLMIRLNSRSPMSFLSAGYVLISDEQDNIIYAAASLREGGIYKLNMCDGSATAQIKKINLNK